MICNVNCRRLLATDRVISLAGSCRQSCWIALHPLHYCGIDSLICCWILVTMIQNASENVVLLIRKQWEQS